METGDFIKNTLRAVDRFLGFEKEVEAVPQPSYTEKFVLRKVRSWLTSVAAKALGYDAEFREYFRHGWLKDCVVDLSRGIADVAVRDPSSDRYAKAIQSKAVATHEKNAVTAHIRKAIGQLMGMGKENPRPGDRWVVQVEIWNPENPWPYPSDTSAHSLEELKTSVEAELRSDFRQAEIDHNKGIHNLQSYLSDIEAKKLALGSSTLATIKPLSLPPLMASLYSQKLGNLTPQKPEYAVVKDPKHPRTTRPVVKLQTQQWDWTNAVTVKIRWACGCALKDKLVSGLVFNVVRSSQNPSSNNAEHYQFLCVKETFTEGHDWRRFTGLALDGKVTEQAIATLSSLQTGHLAAFIQLVLTRMLQMHEFLKASTNPAGIALRDKLAGWSKNIASTALGYDAEMREIRRHRYEPMKNGGVPKDFVLGHGDVTLGTGTFAKTIQSKAVSTENPAIVDKHLLKALGQLLGTGGEDPRPGDRWVIQVEIWNNANPWPYGKNLDKPPTLDEIRTEVLGKIRHLFVQAEKTHASKIHKLKSYLEDVEDPMYGATNPHALAVATQRDLVAQKVAANNPKSTRMYAQTATGWKPLNAVTVKIRWAYPPAVESSPGNTQFLSSLVSVVRRTSTNSVGNSATHYAVACEKVSWNTDPDWQRFL